MNSNQKIFSVANFDITKNHLLIILILSLSFSISFFVRSIPAIYGWELNEFDPFFNYRATEYIVENGIDKYYTWNDSLSWYPYGRDVSSNSQTTLHITTSILYQLFGQTITLYDFTIIFPAIIGSLTTILIFAVVRILGGTRAGLIASLLFSVSIPIIIRGSIGWFKSEPLGLFFGLLMLYIFLSGIFSKSKKNTILKLLLSGILLPISVNAWGGNQFFVIVISLFIFSLIFTKKDLKNLIIGIPLFYISTIITGLIFERPGLDFVYGLSGISIISSTLFFFISFFIKQKSNEKSQNRNCAIFFGCIIVTSFLVLYINDDSNFLHLPTHRYLNVINPFLTTTDPLVDSVAEHSITQIHNSFTFHNILLIFSAIGIWMLFNNIKEINLKVETKTFLLIFVLIGAYVGATFMRLEVFTSISLIIISSVAISILIEKSKLFISSKIKKLIFVSLLMSIIFIPLLIFNDSNVFAYVDNPPTILNGGTTMKISTTDWNDTLIWIKNNTPSDSVIAAWWDYGYWIQTKSERATLTDNSTVIDHVIKNLAQILLSEPDDGWNSLNSLEADYIVIFIAGERLGLDGIDGQPLYLLRGGGDESKKFWFIKIAEEPIQKYLLPDGISGTDYFWNNTLLGKLIPFEIVGYVDPISGQQFSEFLPGTIGVYKKNIKFDENDSFRLVYSSGSFDADYNQQMISVFVYEINPDYKN